jgi:hypothetical protein
VASRRRIASRRPGACDSASARPWARRASWPVSRILFRAAAAKPTAARRRPSIWTHRCRVPRAAYPQARASGPRTPARPHRGCGLLGLASGGVCLATPVTRNAGALLPHRFTLTTTRVAVCFLWHFPASHLGLLLAITLLCEVRTFLDSGAGPLELTEVRHEPRPPSQLVRDEHGTRRTISRPAA